MTNIIPLLSAPAATQAGRSWAAHAKDSSARRAQVQALVTMAESLPDFDESDRLSQELADAMVRALGSPADLKEICDECELPMNQLILTRNALAFLDGAFEERDSFFCRSYG